MATKTLVTSDTRVRGKRDHYTNSRASNSGALSSSRLNTRNNVDSKSKRVTSSPGRDDTVSGRSNSYSKLSGVQKKNGTSETSPRGRAEERPRGHKNSKTSDGSPVSVSKLKNLFDKTIADEQEKAKKSYRHGRPQSEFMAGKTKKSQDSDRWSLPSYAKKSSASSQSHKIYVSEGLLAKRAKFAAGSTEDIAVKKHSPRLSDLVPDIDLHDLDASFRSRSKSDSWIKPSFRDDSQINKSRSKSEDTCDTSIRNDPFSRKTDHKNRLKKSKSADTLDVDDSVFESEPKRGFGKSVKQEVQRKKTEMSKGEKGKPSAKKKEKVVSNLNGIGDNVGSDKKKPQSLSKLEGKDRNTVQTKKNEKQPWEREAGVVKTATWFDEEIPESEKTMELESVHLDVKVERKRDSNSSDITQTIHSAEIVEKEKVEQSDKTHPEIRNKIYKTEEKNNSINKWKSDGKSQQPKESKPKAEIEENLEKKLDNSSRCSTNMRQEETFVPENDEEEEEGEASSEEDSGDSMVEHSSQDEDDQFYRLVDATAYLDRQPLSSVLVVGPKKEKQSRKVGFAEVSPSVHATYSAMDYERGNDSIDPVTASAEWELEKRVEKMDIFSVDLEKDNRGLGLSIIGLGVGTDTGVEKLGIFVKSLTENGAAEKDGRIQVNDQIIEVDNISLVGVTQLFAAQTLQHTSGTVRFLMGREKSRLHHMKSTDPQLAKEIEDLKLKLQQAEEKALKAEEKTKDAISEIASLKADSQKSSKNKSNKDTKQVSKLEEQLKQMTEALKEAETDLAISEAENQDTLKQLEEIKEQNLILEKKYQTNKNKMKEQQEREQAFKDEITCKNNHIKSLENQVKDLRIEIEESRKLKTDNIRSNDFPTSEDINGTMQVDDNIQKKSPPETDPALPKSSEEFTKSDVVMRNVSRISPSPPSDDESLHRFSYVGGDSLFPSEWKDPTKLDFILDWKKTDGNSKDNEKDERSSTELDLNSMPETSCLNNDYSLDKIRVAEQQDKKHKPTRASYGRDLDDRDEMWKGSLIEDGDDDDHSEHQHNTFQNTKASRPSGPGLFLPKLPEGGFKLKSTGRNLKDDSDLSKQQPSSHEMTRSSFPLAGRDQTHGIVVENLLDKQLTKADVKVSSLPSAFGQEGKTVNKLSDSQNSLDASHNSLLEIEEAKKRIDSDLNSSMASSRGSSPFLPPAMPLLEVKSQVYNEVAVDVPADFENIVSSPSDESLHGGSLEVDSGSIDSRSVGSANAVRSPNLWTSRSITEWDSTQVGLWLVGLQLEEYTSEFSKEGIDGKRLLAIDNSKLKALGVKKEHKALLKKNIKQLKLEAEKEQKAKKKEEKEQKSGNLMTKGIKTWKGWKGEYTVNND